MTYDPSDIESRLRTGLEAFRDRFSLLFLVIDLAIIGAVVLVIEVLFWGRK